MGVHDLADRAQAEPGSLALGGEEGRKKLVHRVLVDPGAVVDDGQMAVVDPDLDFSPGPAGLKRVQDEVAAHLFDPATIGLDDGIGRMHAKRDPRVLNCPRHESAIA